MPFNGDCSGGEVNEDSNTLPHSAPDTVEIASGYQPPDGSKLQWRRYLPDPAIYGNGPFYTIVTIHGGHFAEGSPFEGGVEKVAEDLRDQGYLVLSVTYRLAPCGLITGQPDHSDPASGRPPEQTDDIKSLIRAARVDPKSNGHVAVVGGSAGAVHAIFVGFDKTPSPANTYPNWCQNGADDRPECVVALSATADFSDRTGTETRLPFIQKIENYTNTCTRVDPNGGYDQKSVSPIAKLNPQNSFKPLFAASDTNENVPPSQSDDLKCALEGAGIESSLYKIIVIEGSNHAFAIWTQNDPDAHKKVREEVFDFLSAQFKNP